MRSLLVAALLAAAASASAPAQDLSDVEIRVERLAPGVAALFGRGGNIALSYGEDSNVLIDDQFAPLTDKILAAVESLNPGPVRFVINTHWHGDHTGGNENLGKRGAVIMAHDNVRERLSSEQVRGPDRIVPPSPKDALPVVTYGEGVTLHLNGDTLHVIHLANAHTDGDSIVHWAKADVLHMGDTFFHKVTFPFVDLGSGGSIDGLIAAADKGLKLAGADTKIIPGHGPLATRADLLAYREMLVDIRGKVADAIAAGQSLEQIQAARIADRYGMPDGFIKPDAFIEAVFTSLRNPPSPAGNGAHHKH